MKNYTEQIAEFVSKTEFEDIPSKTIDNAKLRILDTLGVMIAGSNEPVSSIVLNCFLELGGKPAATILGTQKRSEADAQRAAIINATFAHSLDFDDALLGKKSLLGHPSAVIVPTALATAESSPKAGRTGKDLLGAYIIGVEVLGRIGSMVNPSHYESGFHATSTIGALGAACTAGKIIGLDSDGIARALGIAASMSSGLKINFGTMTKPFHAGIAAGNGILAASLAKGGLTSSANILEAKGGFVDILSEEEIDSDSSSAGGEENSWYVDKITMKPYPSCAATHAIIDSAARISKERSLKPSDVSSMQIEISSLSANILNYDRPSSGLEGKFSAHYCAAVALAKKQVVMSDFTDQKVSLPEIRELESKISVNANNSSFGPGDMGASVTVETINGGKYSFTSKYPYGSPENPMSLHDITSKFKDCVQPMLGRENEEKIIRKVLNLEKVQAIKDIVELLVPEG